eukprot:scaffold20938_cov116-Isochrysis_galbana.AAC.6
MVRCWPYRRKCAVGAASAGPDEAREGCLSWGYFRARDGADKESVPGPMSEPACRLAPSGANARRKRPLQRLHGTFWRLAAVGFISSLSISARGASEPSVTPCALPLASGMRLSSDHTLRAWGGRGGRGGDGHAKARGGGHDGIWRLYPTRTDRRLRLAAARGMRPHRRGHARQATGCIARAHLRGVVEGALIGGEQRGGGLGALIHKLHPDQCSGAGWRRTGRSVHGSSGRATEHGLAPASGYQAPVGAQPAAEVGENARAGENAARPHKSLANPAGQLHAPEVPQPGGAQPGKVPDGRLGFCREDGIAAAHVCQHQVILSPPVAQVDRVRLARVSAVLVALAIGEEPAEHAVLSVEHGQVLMHHYLQPRGHLLGHPLGQSDQLLRRQVVRRHDARHAVRQEERGGQRVGSVERRVAAELGHRRRRLRTGAGGLGGTVDGQPITQPRQRAEQAGRSHQQRIGAERQVEAPEPLLVRLEHPRRCHHGALARLPHRRHRLT